jgi:hypothetical protein
MDVKVNYLLLPIVNVVINFIIDINECIDENLNTCEQLCDNTAATHSCLCFDGYELNSDGFSCSGLA